MIYTHIEKQDIRKLAAMPYSWSALKNKTVLISGGTGFIGSYMIEVLKERNAVYGDNISIVCLSRHALEDEGCVKYIAADITKPFEIAADVDFIIHLASNTHPAQYSVDPIGTITTNVLGCYNLLEVARAKNTKRFLLASSVEIYGNGDEKPFAEQDCGYIDCNTARSGYNESKRVSESLCQSYREQYGVECVVGRLARVFGADRKNDTKALAQFMEKAVRGEDIVLKSEGKQRFSYCYVTDAVSGLLKILLDGKSGEAYNVSAEDEGKTLGDYARQIASLAGTKVVFDLVNGQKGASVSNFALLDCGKLKMLGWAPSYTVEQGLKSTYEIKKVLNSHGR